MTDYERLLKKHGKCEGLCGVNEDGENVIVSIDDRTATIRTFQKNGFIRINVYHNDDDGTSEELFEH